MTAKPQPGRAAKVAMIADWLVAGAGRSRVGDYAATEGWTDGPADVEALTVDAEAQIVADAQSDLPGATLTQARTIRGLYLAMAGAANDADWKTALAARRELNRFLAAAAPAQAALPAAPGRGSQLLQALVLAMPSRMTDAKTQIVAEAKAVPILAAGAGPRADRTVGGGAAGGIRGNRGRGAGRTVPRGR